MLAHDSAAHLLASQAASTACSWPAIVSTGPHEVCSTPALQQRPPARQLLGHAPHNLQVECTPPDGMVAKQWGKE